MNIPTLLPMLFLEKKEEKKKQQSFYSMKAMPKLFFSFIFPSFIHSSVHYCCIVI